MFGGGAGAAADGSQPPPIKSVNTNGDTEAPDQPGDSVSCLAWSSGNLLAAGSWDKSVRVWEVAADGSQALTRACYEAEAPVLCCGFARDGHRLVSGGCDQKVRVRDLQAQRDQDIGRHEGPVKELALVDDLGLVATGSWDKTLRFWTASQASAAATLQLPERVYAMDAKFPMLAVGTADRHVLTYDLRKVQQDAAALHTGFSPLRMQTRSLSIFTDKSGYAVGSIEGRCGIHHFSDEGKNFTFKCHRTEQTIASINSIDFHPVHGSFATAGSDGIFTFWDKERRQRLKGFNSCHYPITAGKFSADGNRYAYAVSYDWSQAHEAYRPDLPRQVLIHRVTDSEVLRR